MSDVFVVLGSIGLQCLICMVPILLFHIGWRLMGRLIDWFTEGN